MRRFHFGTIPLLVVGMIGLAVVPLGCKQEEGEEAEATRVDPVPVRVSAAEHTTLRPTLEVLGTLMVIPEQTAVVSTQVGGTIAAVAVVEGQHVKAGDELVRLDTRLLEAEAAKLEPAVAEQAAVVSRLKRGFLPQEIEIARHDIAKFRANAETAKSKLAGLSALREKNEVSSVQFDAARQALQAAEAELAGASSKLALLEAGARPEEIAEAEAKRAAAEAGLAAAKLGVQLGRITSPIRGVVSQLSARLGMTVDRTTALATVVDDSTVFVQFRIPNAYLCKVQAGALVQATLTCMPGETFQGKIARLSTQADPATGDVDAFATLTNDKGALRPGLGCRVHVQLPEIPGATVIPVAAVADRAGTAVVTVVKDNKAREVEVKLGIQAQDRVQVLEGIAPGDLIATENGYGLPDDCPVRILQGAAPPDGPKVP